ncbi:MAG TPA: hypothetical protein DCZ95_18450 [Verrucomicrobia bacterium]|nr:MAG: hypothetical protein A2X46_16595 [Lentisphaerae bacterium GWF2_57_35]HBA86070.1 hypothetical protein [Verrucomicrobiota bacterium]
MPVYNGAEHVREAMDSVLRQTFDDFEFLIIDDASSDATPEILQQCGDPRIRVIRNKERLRLANALNLGLDEARGELVARMDADDRCQPRRLEKQVLHLEQNPSLGVCGSWIRKFGAENFVDNNYPVGASRVKAFALFNTPFAHPSVMVRRSLLAKHGLRFDVSYYPTEDYELWSRALECFDGDNVPEVLLDYRVHGKSMTGADWNNMDQQAARINGTLLNRLGMNTDEATTRFHRDLGMSRIPASKEAVSRAESWLLSLIRANEQRLVYDDVSLRVVIGDFWFRNCMNASSVGTWLIENFYRSELTRLCGVTARRKGLLFLSVCRRGFIRTRSVK